MRKFVFIFFLFSLAVIFVSASEVLLRSRDIRPWQIPVHSTAPYPDNNFFRTHTTLGYSHLPGKFKVPLGSDYVFNVNHRRDSLRITHPVETNRKFSGKEKIWIFGCSITHGWSVNDEETFPWLLQERLPEYKVVNFGVTGYGTIHSLIQFRDALNRKPPKVVVLAYCKFHNIRNINTRAWRKRIAPYNKLGPIAQPYARMDKDGKLQYLTANLEYQAFPLMKYSALAHFIEKKYNQFESKWHQKDEVSKALVNEMAMLARKHDVKFIVANIKDGQAMLDFAEKNKILNIDISVDYALSENNNLPYDHHPSAIAHKKYADKLEGFLRTEL